jgi:hypothetical protein
MTNSSVTVGASVVMLKSYILFTGTWRLLLLVWNTKEKVVQSSRLLEAAMENLTVLSLQQMLQGLRVLKVVQSSGVLGGQLLLKLEVMITAGGRPLYVIDGVPLNDGY